MRFHFRARDVRPLVEATKAATAFKLTMGERFEAYGEEKGYTVQPNEEREHGKPALWLVKDDGVYLMSNRVMGDDYKCGERVPVAYARGFGEGTHLGGDDFVERLDIGLFEHVQDDDPDIAIELTDTELLIDLKARV